eukprot:scaffold6181_cov129-Isochrysis_galbana.AAC.5
MAAGRAGAKNEMTSVARKQLDRPCGPPPFASAAAVIRFGAVPPGQILQFQKTSIQAIRCYATNFSILVSVCPVRCARCVSRRVCMCRC